MAALDEAKYLQLAENLAGFRSKLRLRAETLDIAVRQQILRLMVKEVLVGNDTVTLRHSIPIPRSEPGPSGSPAPPAADTGSTSSPGYLLRSGSRFSAARQRVPALRFRSVEPWRKKVPVGEVIVVRYADDLVVGFESRTEAERFLASFRERLAKFGLELHVEKTRLIELGQFAERNRKGRGEGKL